MNMVLFENGRVDLVEVFTMVQRKTWLGHNKKKIGCFLLLRLVFGTSLLYEVFERLIFWVI